MTNHNYFVYIITNPGRTALYTGVTKDLAIVIQERASPADVRENLLKLAVQLRLRNKIQMTSLPLCNKFLAG